MAGSAATTADRARSLPIALVRAVPAWAWLCVLVAVSAAIRFDLARGMVGPWIMVDELIYSELAKSFAATGHFLVREDPTGTAFGFVYPMLISPAYKAFGPVPEAYAAAKAINSVAMSLAAVPAYFLARRVLQPWLSLLAAVLTVAVPSMVYTGTLMTENAFYPLFLCSALALVLVLERPTLIRILVLFGVTGLAFATRAQAAALVPAILSAPLLLTWFDRRGWRGLRPYRVLYALAGGGVLLVLVAQLARGRSPLGVLGVYKAAGESHYAVSDVARWFLYHVAELDLYVGIVPFAALLVLAGLGRRLPRPSRAFVAASLPLIFWLLLLVAAFASRPDVSRIEERNSFYVAPLFLIALLVWIEVGAPRPALVAGAAVVAAAALPGVIPYSTLINVPAISDTLSLLPWWRLQDTVITLDDVPAVVVMSSVVAALLFLVVPRRMLLVLPVLVLFYFALEQHPIESSAHGVRQASVGSLFQGITNPHRDWIDRTVGRNANVVAITSGVFDRRFTIWQNEFFNRSVGAVFDLGTALPGNLPETSLSLDPRTGFLRRDGKPVRARYVLADASMISLSGERIAADDARGMVLLRVDGPLRAESLVHGLYPSDTWSGPTASYTRFECGSGSLLVTLQSDPGLFRSAQSVVARVAGRVVARASVSPTGTTPMKVPLQGSGGRCTVDFAVGRTLVPKDVTHGTNPDDRRLGVHFLRFEYSAR